MNDQPDLEWMREQARKFSVVGVSLQEAAHRIAEAFRAVLPAMTEAAKYLGYLKTDEQFQKKERHRRRYERMMARRKERP